MKLKLRTVATHRTKSKPIALVVPKVSHCNRCGRKLTNEHSILKGIGPVCGRKGIKGLSNPYEPLTTNEHDLIVAEFDSVVECLAKENLVLPHEIEHREALRAIDRVTALGAAYEVLGQICNEVYNLMPTDVRTAVAVKQLFVTLGNPDEGNKAHKRIIKVANLSL